VRSTGGWDLEAFETMEQTARRLTLLAAIVGAGGLSQVRGARVLDSVLRELEASSSRPGVEPIRALAAALRATLGHLVPDGERPLAGRNVLILEHDEVSADLVALAVEAEGHAVSIIRTADDLLRACRRRRFDVILTESAPPGLPVDGFCRLLREAAGAAIPIVLFGDGPPEQLQTIALNAGADRHICKDQGIDDLVAELRSLFDAVLY
jgi:CheY-like chemotaxis protein